MKARWLSLPILIASLLLIFNGSYIQAKAIVAQWLLLDAWEETLAGGNSIEVEEAIKPWPWADIWPVASLSFVTSQNMDSNPFDIENALKSLIVLNESSGQGLAFGPSVVASSVDPGDDGWFMVAGHRDTHFGFLETAKIGDHVIVEDRKGERHYYQLDTFHVVDSRTEGMPSATEINEPGLMLITCYPFDLVDSGGPLRYVAMGKISSGR